ncbi:MAG: hypothetical protein WC485_01915 [Opitutaceae bacterium]
MSDELVDLIAKINNRDLSILVKAKKDAQDAVIVDASHANLRALEAATAALDAVISKSKNQKSEVLPNTLEVVRYLQKRGFKVKKSKVYADARAGKLPRGPCSVDDADKYASREELPRLAEVAAGELDRIAKQRSEAEYRLLEKKYEKLAFELEKDKGQWMPRDQFDQELSARAAVLLHGLRHLAQSRASELLDLGKSKGPQAMGDRMQADIEELLNDYANRETFQVIVMPEAHADRA